MPNVGPLELAVVVIIAIVILGPKKFPEVGRSLGKGIREFKGTISGDPEKPSLEPGTKAPASEPALEREVVTQDRS